VEIPPGYEEAIAIPDASTSSLPSVATSAYVMLSLYCYSDIKVALVCLYFVFFILHICHVVVTRWVDLMGLKPNP